MAYSIIIIDETTGQSRILSSNDNIPLSILFDISIEDPIKGYCLKSPDGSKWRITINNLGALITTKIA